MALRLPGVGAPTIWAPRPADGIGARPPSTTPAGVGAERGAACGAGAGAGCSDGCSGGAAGLGGAASLGTRFSAALRFPNTLPYSKRTQARFKSLPRNGDNRLDFGFLVSDRPVISCAS